MTETKKECETVTIHDILLKCDPSMVPRFSFNGYESPGIICEVYSGDSVTILFPFMGQLTKISARLKGIYSSREYTSFLWNRVEKGHKVVDIIFDRFDKYGHPLVTLYIDDVCINEEMVKKGFAEVRPTSAPKYVRKSPIE